MNFFKKIYCRAFQLCFRAVLPVLPYREPRILLENSDLIKTLKSNNITNVLFVTSKDLRELKLTQPLEKEIKNADIKLSIFDGTVPNPTTQNVEDALKIYKENNCQALIGFGGGSVMDCAKGVGVKIARPNKTLDQMAGILKVNKKIPLLIAVPTTAGTGSETTLACVITDSETRHKFSINDFNVIPRYALLDANLTLDLPKPITSSTGMDALTHAIEAYIGRSTTKSTRKNSLIAVKLIFNNLPIAYKDGHNFNARQNMLKASYLAGLAFTKSYVGYVHAIAHSLGGKYNVAHGLANAIILPYVLKAYGKKVYKKLYNLGLYAGLFDKTLTIKQGAELFIKKIEELNSEMAIGKKIDSIKTEDIPSLAQVAEKEANPLYPVPMLMTAKQLEQIYLQLV